MVGASCEVGRVVIEANCGYRIDQTDVDGLVDAVLYLAENLDEADKLGKNARKVLLEKYSTQKIADRYLQVIANSAHCEINLLQDNNEDISEKNVSAGV